MGLETRRLCVFGTTQSVAFIFLPLFPYNRLPTQLYAVIPTTASMLNTKRKSSSFDLSSGSFLLISLRSAGATTYRPGWNLYKLINLHLFRQFYLILLAFIQLTHEGTFSTTVTPLATGVRHKYSQLVRGVFRLALLRLNLETSFMAQ